MTDLQKPVQAWPITTIAARLGACRAMLYLHGFITDAENDRIHARLIKEHERQATAGKPAVTGEPK